jgi:hypothetical protein
MPMVIEMNRDNRGIHTSKAVQAALATDLSRVRLHVLPPSCPRENRGKRRRRDLHANITRAHQHVTMDGLPEAVHAFLTAIAPPASATWPPDPQSWRVI